LYALLETDVGASQVWARGIPKKDTSMPMCATKRFYAIFSNGWKLFSKI
jgi:hypothetical protein